MLTLLRTVLFFLLAGLLPFASKAQYFFTGSITNDIEQPLPGVSLQLQQGARTFRTDSSGRFRIPSRRKTDTLICRLPGYDSLKKAIRAGQPDTLQLLPVPAPEAGGTGAFLSSLTRNLAKDPGFIRQLFNEETYRTLVENGFVKAGRFPETGFTLNVNKASYSNVRRFLNSRTTIPPAAVRIEEMLNYFSLDCGQPPAGKEVFRTQPWLSTCPWNPESLLLFIQVQARKINLDKVPPGNLVFLIDDSGSMDMPNRLPLLQTAFKMLVANLRPQDTVTIVTYGDHVGIWLPPTGGADKQKLIESIESLKPGGATPGASGIRLAYQMAEKTFKPGANNRVILATDGDFNVGIKDDQALEDFIVRYRNSGIYLTCLGVGMGNYKDSKLETLARYGKGNFAYLDNEQEAQKVLVTEFSQTAVTVANDVLLHIRFDPGQVQEYRLIGFDNAQQALADTSGRLQGGNIGSGHRLMALFELKPVLPVATLLKNGDSTLPVATARLQYRQPGKRSMEYHTQPVCLQVEPFDQLLPALRFATSVAMLGQTLRQSPFSRTYGLDEVGRLAAGAADPADAIQQAFIGMVENARSIYRDAGEKKKKRK